MMSSDDKRQEQVGLSRRDFMMAGAAGAAGMAAAGFGMGTASAAPALPPEPREQPRANSPSGVRTAIVTDTRLNRGPYLAEEFARRGYNLVIADVQEGLPDKLRGHQ